MQNNFLGELPLKLLDDCSHFDRDPVPVLSSSGGGTLYYRKKRASYHVAGLNMGEPDRELIHTFGIQRVSLLPGAHFRRLDVPYLSVEYIRSGYLQFRQGGRGYELKEGEIFLFQPYLTGDFYAVDSPCHKISIVVNGPLLIPYLAESGLGGVDVLCDVDTGKLDSFIRDFEMLSLEHGKEAERKNGVQTWAFLDFLRNPQCRPHIPRYLIHFEEYCLEHLSEPLTVENMAAACSLSVSHFIRLCREFFGETPYQHLIRLRMRTAASLLLSPEQCSIKRIASRCGYPNALNFSAKFRKFFGVSPRNYILRSGF